MCETKRVAWRPEVPEHAKMGSMGGLRDQMWVLRVPDQVGNEKNVIWSKIFFEKNAFFDPKTGLFAHKMGQNGVQWGSTGSILGF